MILEASEAPQPSRMNRKAARKRLAQSVLKSVPIRPEATPSQHGPTAKCARGAWSKKRRGEIKSLRGSGGVRRLAAPAMP